MSREFFDEVQGLAARVGEVVEKYRKIVFSREPGWVKIGGRRRSIVVASDASRVTKLYRYLLVYAVQALSAPFSDEPGLFRERHRYLAKADLVELVSEDLRDLGKAVRKIVSHVQLDLEVKAAYSVVKDLEDLGARPDLILFDGPMTLFLVNRFKKGSDRVSQSLNESWERRRGMLTALMEDYPVAFVSKAHTVKQRLYRHFEPVLDGKPVPVPDYAIIDRILSMYGRVPGYLEPIEVSERDPDASWLETYAVFSPGGRAYRVILPRRVGEEAGRIMEMIAYHSPSGYPEPLRQCHLGSKMGRRDFQKILWSHGVRLESGREDLGEMP